MTAQTFGPDSDPGREPTDEDKSDSTPSSAAERYIWESAGQTREELKAAKEYAEMIVNTVREALLILDLDLRVRSASRSFYATFQVGPEETEGKLVYELGDGQWDIPELRRLLEDILPEDKGFDDYEVQNDFEGIGHRVMLLNARRLDHHSLILLAIEDVTERRSDARELRASQERFDLLVENAKEYAIFMMDRERRVTVWNPGAKRILGWSEDEIVGRMGDVIFTAEDRASNVPHEEMNQVKREGTAQDNRWHVRKDGSRFWATGYMVALHEAGELRGFAKILRDDTEQKKAEEERESLLAQLARERHELQLLNDTLEERVAERTHEVRSLASTLTMAEQQERRRISQILHDDLQQMLYGIQMKMTFVRKDAATGDRTRLANNAQRVEEWLAKAIETTRRLTVDLSPPLLEGEGLVDALGWLATQMQDVHDLDVELRAEHAFMLEDKDTRVLLFQIVRELLFNVVKHSGTRRAVVELVQLDGSFAIHVADDGRGFNVDEAARRSEAEHAGGFGLFSVRERIGLFGGHMEIDSAPGDGTRVTIYTPPLLDPSNRPSTVSGGRDE